MTNEEAKAFLDNLKICINEHPVVADWLVEIANRKTESNSEKPNNCEELNAYRKCVESRSFWDNKHCDGCYFDERCPFDEPKDEPQRDCLTCRYNSDEWDSPKCDGCSKAHSNYETQTDCAWK